ncbi:tubulin-folding cofactor B isoform X1 [Aquila chrysaetos chrysaetos]|uniref:tubulin-folding cofactor B isoform X1 n=1 Tax=Aquila chrysaetos chrysaetos TaxID=223781 RepID=UPI001B7D453B|nr:tubulin-folding cofactor B isoform X1 [Aquila chrysaetos chrysaetos]
MKAAAEAGAGPGLGPLLGTGSVSLVVSSSLNTFCAHKRYSTGLTIAEFKCKLELVVGSPASCMDLELYGAEEQLLGRLDCDEALLGSYPVADGCRVHSPFGPSCASSVGDIMTLRGHGAGQTSSSNAGPRKQRWRPPSPSVPVVKSGYWDNPPNLPPSCLWAKPTSSEATGWVSAMMSRWASMTAVWAAAVISSASPNTAPSSNPRASPPGTSPRRRTASRMSCEGTLGRGHTGGDGTHWDIHTHTPTHTHDAGDTAGGGTGGNHSLKSLCFSLVLGCPPPAHSSAGLSPQNSAPPPPLAGGGAPRASHALSPLEGGGERAWRAVCCSQWAGELGRRRRCRKEWPMGGSRRQRCPAPPPPPRGTGGAAPPHKVAF